MNDLESTTVAGETISGRSFRGTVSQLLRMLLTCVWVFILSLAVQPTARGQSSTYARLVGTVRDQTDAVVPGVEITATAQATNIPKQP